MKLTGVLRAFVFTLLSLLIVPCAIGQQTGSISGRVTAPGGEELPGVTVEASSPSLPQPRITITEGNGDYRLPALQPGTYTLQFTLDGMQTATRNTQVLLSQDTVADVSLGIAGVSESITVTAENTLVNRESTAIQSALSTEQIQVLPVGQEYRDLIKLIPGVQYTQDQVRGPSAGGSGQDNVYQFDGVNVTMPLFGTLSAEPSSHDIVQINMVKGGAKAVDFDRSGGFTVDTLSKSGTNKLSGLLSYQIQDSSLNSNPTSGSNSRFEQDRTWATVSVGGPILSDRLFFYGSYYRPTRTRENRANLYGELPEYSSERNEYFGKLTFSPISSILLNGSYRDSSRKDESILFLSDYAATTGTGDESEQRIAILEGSWVLSPRSFATAKFTDYALETLGTPDFVLDVRPSIAPGTRLDLANLDRLGRLTVPTPGTNAAANAFFAPFIERYGYIGPTGARTGGGRVGVADEFNDQDFYRESGQIGYNLSLGTNVSHDIHLGYQRYTDSEDLVRSSNGFGVINIRGGGTNCPAAACGTVKPAFFQATLQQQSLGTIPTIHSEYKSQNFEVNDTIRWQNWAFNLGLIASNDTLYGQGLKEDSSTISGFVAAPGHEYEMYDIPFEKMLQPRLGATWAYNGMDTVFTSYARYNPAASSLPRAASYARNLARTIEVYFDADGVLMGSQAIRSSSGKLFVPDMTPRTIDEYLVGTSQQLTSRWSARVFGRHRKGEHFWEDVNNDARIAFNPPPGIKRELYLEDLDAQLEQIGSGDSYVIAEIDGAFTKYYEASLESDWRGDKTFIRGSYTWSHYYGNFDQDASTVDNDQNSFIGSSNLADDPGRQTWDRKYGDLHGDRTHLLKMYGSYSLPWRTSIGAYAFYQSGAPYEIWSVLPYRSLTASGSETNRYAENAGSRRTPDHYQADLNLTQSFPLRNLNLQIVADLYNVFDKQTGYNFENRVGVLGLTDKTDVKTIPIPSSIPLTPAQANLRLNAPYPRNFYDPRRFQIALRLQF